MSKVVWIVVFPASLMAYAEQTEIVSPALHLLLVVLTPRIAKPRDSAFIKRGNVEELIVLTTNEPFETISVLEP